MTDLPATIDTPDGPSVEGAGPSLLRDLLPILEEELSVAGVPVEHFAPGITPDEIRNGFASVNRPVPNEVVEWFQWHNGTSVDSSGRLIPILPRFEHWTLDMVVREVREPWLPYGLEPWEWNPDWIQLTGEHGLIFNTSGAPDAVPAIRALVDDGGTTQGDTHFSQAMSLCTPVAWWIEALATKAIQWNRDTNLWMEPDFTRAPIERWQMGYL